MRRLRYLAALPLLAVTHPAFAQMSVPDSGDTAWVMVCALLALVGTLVGLALHFAARVRARNAFSVMAALVAIAAGTSLVWAIIGYSIAFAPGDALLGGANNFFLANLGTLREGLTLPESAFVLFSGALAIMASTLMLGSVAGRARFGWLAIVAPLWSLVVFAPVARWIWADGWLARMGTTDYSGGLVICVSGGISALVAALIVGRRADYAEMPLSPAHAPSLGLAGVAMVWVGMLSIAGGWALSATDDASTAILNAHLAASAGALAWALLERFITGRASASGFSFGIIAGLAAIASGSGIVGPGGAMLIGGLGAVIAYLAAAFVRRGLHADDAANVFATFGVAGAVGAILLVPFASSALGGVGFDASAPSSRVLIGQAVGVLAVAFWSGLATLVIGFAVSMIIPVRATPEEEELGLDLSLHGERGWDLT